LHDTDLLVQANLIHPQLHYLGHSHSSLG
jgi:hypothetical protein